MIITSLNEILDTERDVRAENWRSRRLLLQSDGMGFSMHDTLIHAGTSTHIHYKHHLEAVYCIEGTGTITLAESGEAFRLEPGVLYALNDHDEHVLEAETQLRMVCVFNPPITGREVHDEDGVYPPPENT
jgi:L-ectoine synthase